MSVAKTQKRGQEKAPQNTNGKTEQGTLAEAIAYEQAIADEANAIWDRDEHAELLQIDCRLLRELRPLLRRQIPHGFIEHVGEVTGKPYESTGVRSVQVQMDRLDNVLGPENWGYEATYSNDGKRCYVRAWVGTKDAPLYTRDSWGGVNRGSTEGNIWKGSFTNAAKLALARLGPAWEVYVGAADFDPDTDKDAAEQQGKSNGEKAEAKPIGKERGERLEKIVADASLSDHLPAKLRALGIKSLDKATEAQGMAVYEWASDAADQQADGGEES